VSSKERPTSIVSLSQTIDWVMRIEDEFFPVTAGELGSSEESCKQQAARLKEFMPTFKVRLFSLFPVH
jgi:hypothetical protein